MLRKFYSGMSLLEMLIAISIFTIGMTGFSLLFANSWRQNAYTLEMGMTAMITSRNVNKMVKYIREVRQGDDGSYPVQLADDNELIVFCDYDKDGKTERLHFYYDEDDHTLYMGVRRPSSSFPITYVSGDESVQVVSAHVVNATSNPVFAYYDGKYPENSSNNPIETPAVPPNVRLVRITIHMNIDPNRAPDNIEIKSFAEMRNLNDHDRFGI